MWFTLLCIFGYLKRETRVSLVKEELRSLVKGKMCGWAFNDENIDGRWLTCIWSIVTSWLSKEVCGSPHQEGLIDGMYCFVYGINVYLLR